MSAAELSLIPEPSTANPLDAAIGRLKEDAGAVFEKPILMLLREIREHDPACWARYRQLIKATGMVSMADLDRMTAGRNETSAVDPDIFPVVTVWPEAVNGSELLNELANIINRHVIADPPTVHAAALWSVFTWFTDAVDVAPIANITAPEKRCGKTVMLGVLSRLACRPMTVSNIAPAALFRALQLWSPTLLIDEVDAFLSQHEEARGILNAGFTRDSAYVIRCVGDDHLPTRFNVWGAKALCGIGKIADTLADRSIPLRLRRKLPGESTVKIRHADPEKFAELTGKLARFAADNIDVIRMARPAEIEGLNDRANDCWEPLLAIAEIAGGNWPRLARIAATTLHGLEEDAPSIGAELLSSIRDVFDNRGAERLSTADLLEALAEDEEAPWATWNRGKPMSPHQLSKRLGEFGIKPTTVRIGHRTAKGYLRERFDEAFKRYLSANSSVTPSHPCNRAGYRDSKEVTHAEHVTDDRRPQTSNDGGCHGVTGPAGIPGNAVDESDVEMF